ncbi:MAG: ribonuclease D [Alphaproteobacteria bacterium]|nr:ribonuclease D [Alphaproteobacteria bacterium]
MDETPLIMVEDADTLASICEHLHQQAVIGVDTESDSMHHYREKVCLIQISDSARDYIIDPLAIEDISALGPVLADPAVVKVLHGADYDVVCLKRDFDFNLRGIFDTMIAAQFLGLPKVGLADLIERFFGVHIDKKYQTHDWAMRPLQPEHVDYARGDTHFLIALREVLSLKLERKGRAHIVAEECALVEQREWRQRSEVNAWMHMKGVRRMDETSQRVLRQLHNLRDDRAQAMDRPPYKVFPDQIMTRLAVRRPTTLDGLHQLGRPRSSMFRRYGEAMLEAVKAGLEDASPLPEPPPRKKSGTRSLFGTRETERFAGLLKEWRAKVRKRDQVPLVLVASNAQLKAIAGVRPQTLDQLREIDEIRGWQVTLYGEEILEQVHRFEETVEATRSRSGKTSRKRRKRRRKES